MPTRTVDRLGTLITHATVFGSWPEMQQVTGILGRFSRTAVVLRIAWLLAALEAWRSFDSNDRDRKLRDFVFPSLHERFPSDPNRFAFARYSLLWLMRQAFLHCPEEGVNITSRADLEMLGVACLMSNDLSFYKTPRHLVSDLDVIANFMPSMEAFSQEEFLPDMARARHILTEVAAQRPDLRGFVATIENSMGSTFAGYCDLTLGTAMKAIIADASDVATFVSPGIRPENFDTTSVSPPRVASFLSSISADITTIADEFRTGTTPADFTAIRKWPLLRLDDGSFAILDVGFLMDKAGKSFIWKALEKYPHTKRLEGLGLWGELFELYVKNILREVVHPGRRVFSSPWFTPGSEALDICILENRTLIAIETKASTVPSSVRYADNPSDLEKDLEKRFVVGDQSGPKGVKQIANFLERFARGEPLFHAEGGEPIDRTTVDKIIPILVHLDPALKTIRVNKYFARRLKDLARIKRPTVTPLAVLHVAELERLQAWTSDLLWSDIVQSYLHTMRTDPDAVFFADQVPIMRSMNRRAGPMQERINDIIDGMGERFFPGCQIS